MTQPLNLAVRSYLLRKNLIAMPFELAGAAGAFFLTTGLVPALLSVMIGDLIGDQIGRRVAQASSTLDNFTAREIKDFQPSKPLLTSLLLILIPILVALATWQGGLPANHIVGWAGIAWSAAHLAYRYLAFVKERSEAVNA